MHFLEVGPRAGGNMIPLQLSDAFGVDLVKANIAVAMGEIPQMSINEQPGCFVTYVLHSYVAGKFKDVEFAENISPYVYRKVLYKKEGDDVEFFDGAGKALGIVFLHFGTVEEMNQYCDDIEDLVKIILI